MVNLQAHIVFNVLFDEVVIADFGPFQIAVLTATRLVERAIFSTRVPVPERIYQPQGWLIYNYQLIANLDGLKINPIFAEDSHFRPLRRLAPAVPLSFEVKSSQTLLSQVTEQAAFVCRFMSTDFPYWTVFRNIAPHFVRIYPFKHQADLLSNTKQLLVDEAIFIAQNREQLKKVAFFRSRFKL